MFNRKDVWYRINSCKWFTVNNNSNEPVTIRVNFGDSWYEIVKRVQMKTQHKLFTLSFAGCNKGNWDIVVTDRDGRGVSIRKVLVHRFRHDPKVFDVEYCSMSCSIGTMVCFDRHVFDFISIMKITIYNCLHTR